MTEPLICRREFFAGAAAAVATAAAARDAPAAEKSNNPSFIYSLNTATIRGQKLTLPQTIGVAAKAGYDAVEPWITEINDYLKAGGSLKELKRRIDDTGLAVESSVAFSTWIVDDPAEREKGLEQAKRDMDALAQIGAKRMAAPPAGAARKPGLDLLRAAGRYRKLLETAESFGVVPQLEHWGFSKNISRLGEAALVAIESGHPKACILADVFHIYKAGSDFNGLKLLSRRAVQVFHVNDYPAEPTRDKITDADRLYPGDGIAPLTQILRDLHENAPHIVLSLELFNRTYWKQDALTVAKTGLRKTKAAVKTALT